MQSRPRSSYGRCTWKSKCPKSKVLELGHTKTVALSAAPVLVFDRARACVWRAHVLITAPPARFATAGDKVLYTHVTTATNTDHLKLVWAATRHIVTKRNLEAAGLLN